MQFKIDILTKTLKCYLVGFAVSQLDANSILIDNHIFRFGDKLTIDGVDYGSPGNVKSIWACITRSRILGNINYKNLSYFIPGTYTIEKQNKEAEIKERNKISDRNIDEFIAETGK